MPPPLLTPSKGRGTPNPLLPTLSTYAGISHARLQALYSDFSRQKSSNPASFHSALDWWSATLQDVLVRSEQADAPHTLILSVSPTLPERFRYEGVGKPLALSAVIAELICARTLIPRGEFTSSTRSVLDPPGWGPLSIASALVWTPLRWALAQAGLVDAEHHETDTERWRRVSGEHVVIPLVQRAAEAVLEHQREIGGATPTDALYDFESFRREFGSRALEGAQLSELDVKVLVRFLERDEKVVAVSGNVIKFFPPSTTPQITSTDIGLLELKNAVHNTQAQVDRLHAQIDKCSADAGAALKLGRKEAALSHLRARRDRQSLLAQRLGALDNLQGTLSQVETAAGDVQLLESYASAAQTLHALLAHPSLARENVDATLEALTEANADVRELDDAIRAGGPQIEFDEDEIADELAALVDEVRADEDRRKPAAEHGETEAPRLPSVPSTMPERERARVPEKA